MKDNSTKRSQRTPAEIIAETEAKLERLRMKEAKQQAQANPAVSTLLDRKAEIQKDIREAKKVLGSGPQSASARLEKHYAWIDKIQASIGEAEATLSASQRRIEEIDAQIQAEVASVVASKEMSAEA
jgi:capsule polysaccharide export protein KpsE/RkpR